MLLVASVLAKWKYGTENVSVYIDVGVFSYVLQYISNSECETYDGRG